MGDQPPEHEFVAHNLKARLAFRALLSFGFVTLGCVLIGFFGIPGDEPLPLFLISPVPYAGLFSVIFFGYCGSICMMRLVDGEPAILIDERGILIRGSYMSTLPLSDKMIAWSEIERLGIINLSGETMIGIDVSHPDKFVHGKWPQRAMAKFRNLSGYDGGISATGTDRSFEELIASLERLAPARLAIN